METQKFDFFFSKKFEIGEIEFCLYPEFLYAEKKIALASSISVLHK